MLEVPISAIRTYGETDRGLEREENEDNFMLSDIFRVYAVADGLGGLPEGSVASTMAVRLLSKFLADSGGNADLKQIIHCIHEDVAREGERICEDIGIGTTLTAVRIESDSLHIAHVGDTGAFLFRGNEIRKLTRDHTMAQDMLERMAPGEETHVPDYFHHTLTRCVGQTGDFDVDTYDYPIQSGDRILIYSDGVTKTMDAEELADGARRFDSPEDYVRSIIRTANQRGGPDNITAVALYID